MPRLRADGTVPTATERGVARAVLNRLRRRYPHPATALDHRNPWELLVATVLSAQTTDETVNRVTPRLFARYPTPEALAGASVPDVEEIVFPTGFYRQKAATVVGLAVELVERFDGVVPGDLDELVTLRGVGRKTASIVLAAAFGEPAIAVDTHVGRVATRLGLTTTGDPAKIETDLKALFPVGEWAGASLALILFGREVCTARSPRCGECELASLCPWPEEHL